MRPSWRRLAATGATTTAFARWAHSTVAPLRTHADSRGAQLWLQALEKAPCMVCEEHPVAEREDCAHSGFPLTCSAECAATASVNMAERLDVFRVINQDLAYTASPAARKVLTEVVTPAQRETSIDSAITTWENFVRLHTKDPVWLGDRCARRLVSAAYTFPMTLSSLLPHLLDATTTDSKDLTLHVVGARAEAMMPKHIWDELARQRPDYRFKMWLVGDHVPKLPRKKRQNCDDVDSRLTIDTCTGFYHDVASTELSSTLPDAYVLFNPGVGHPHLRELWRPTMDLVLNSGKPALLTSFSERDQQRDLNALRELYAHHSVRFLVGPGRNTFRSLQYQLDPADVFSPIQTNSHVMVIRGHEK
ncbi:TPA: hypothetical protein N0F65_010887 [Lagenidium giganteum]|uniref:Mitochondrial splicing suppressor 51-like C-terminal domain-containing protein n=1 Tax=Lagenidium giganteum TaxID=4803 RepID=A0AAV2YJQ8_9STRA|nr:TPA: hypothetical protein N0F65_010887 [Lagenidium giganteum]